MEEIFCEKPETRYKGRKKETNKTKKKERGGKLVTPERTKLVFTGSLNYCL